MSYYQWGIVGIGKLGKAIVHQLHRQQTDIHFYHHNPLKAEKFKQEFPNTQAVTKEELSRFRHLILALPAGQIVPFIQELEAAGISLKDTLLINLATAKQTSELQETFPHLQWMSLKFMGHSEDLRINGNGLFIAEPKPAHGQAEQEAIEFFSLIGKVMFDKETSVEKLNKLATYYAIKLAKELEAELRQQGFPKEYEDRALASLAPEVLRSYARGTMGHFAQSIADSFSKKDR